MLSTSQNACNRVSTKNCLAHSGLMEIPVATRMDKSLGTNLHLWRFFTRAKPTVTREFIYTCSAPPPPPTHLRCWTRVHSISPEFQHCIWEGGGGEQRILKRITVLFENLKTQKINAITQVSQGILSTIVVKIVQIGLNKSMNKGTKSIRPLTSITGNINTLIHSGWQNTLASKSIPYFDLIVKVMKDTRVDSLYRPYSQGNPLW